MLMVGNIRCFFFKFFKNGRSPLFSIGPSWPFTIGLLTFAFGALVYFLWMLYLLRILDGKMKALALGLMLGNLAMLFAGILKNPGIPQSLIDKILKEQLGKREGHGGITSGDLESGQTTSSIGGNGAVTKLSSPYAGVFYCS